MCHQRNFVEPLSNETPPLHGQSLLLLRADVWLRLRSAPVWGGEVKIRYACVAVLPDEDVLWFHVTHNVASCVDALQAQHNLGQIETRRALRNSLCREVLRLHLEKVPSRAKVERHVAKIRRFK